MGSVVSEVTAARIYDKLAIKNFGLRAKTNFDYTKRDLIKVLEELEEDQEKARSQKIKLTTHNLFKLEHSFTDII